ncbi:unnamed protein product [Discula destructiva]
MSDKEESAPVAAPPAEGGSTTKTETAPAAPVENPKVDEPETAAATDAEEKSEEAVKPAEPEVAEEKAIEEQQEGDEAKAAQPIDGSSEKPTETQPTNNEEDADVKMKDASEATAPAESASKYEKSGETETAAPATATTKTKASARRKSTSAADKSKTLNKKASKAQILHIDAKPGDHYFIKLKGFPQWPCIICDEDMLPHALLKSRPVSAARADGEYREDFADGGKNVANRTFPIMYLATNEFGWVSNKDLIDLDPTKVTEQATAKARNKDLALAYTLAEEHHDLDYYKGVLQQFQEELLEKQKAAEAKAAASKSSKKKGKSAADEDIEMDDVSNEVGAKKDKKRKNPEDAETPQRAESVKKPKIKLTHNSTPKSNGTPSKAAKSGGDAKSSKKAKKPKEESEERIQTPVAPELSPGEKYDRKKKEVLFLRHKLQKGLLTRDQQPKEDEMKLMSEYLLKLEGFPDLDSDIIRTTKINKVLKAMLKLDNIPKEEEFEFKPRSQVLLDKWTRVLAASDVVPQSPPHPDYGFKSATEPKSFFNGVKKADAEKAEESKTEVKEAEKGKDASQKEATPSDDKVTAKMEEATLNEESSKKDEAPSEEKPKVDEHGKDAEAVDAEA